MNLQESIKEISKSVNKVYNETVKVVQTYTRKDCIELNIPYNPYNHLLCDVELLRDGSILYDVKFNPHIIPYDPSKTLQQNIDDHIDYIADATDKDRNKASFLVNVPTKSSFGFISYLSDESAYLSMMSNSDTNILGTANNARLVQTVLNGIRLLLLENADEFKINFNNGSYFDLVSDKSTNSTSLQVFIDDMIQFMTKHQSFLRINKDKIELSANGKISIHNSTTNIKDILYSIIDKMTDYCNTINTNFTASGGGAFIIDPTVIQQFQKIKLDIDKLFV